MGAFDHLVPGDDKPKESEAPGAFDHLVPKTTAGGILRTLAASGVDNVGALMQGGGEIGAKVLNSITGTQDFTATNPLKFATDYIKGGMTEGDKLAAQDSFKGDVLSPSTWEMPATAGGVGHAVAQGLGSILPTAATALASRGRMAPAMAVQGGLMTGGAAAGDIRDNFDKLDHDKLMAASPAYAQLVQGGMNPADARAKVVNESAQTGGLMAGALGAAGGAFNAKLLEDLIAHKGIPALLGKTLAERGVARTITGAATGAVGEGLQEGLEKVGQNAGENIGMGKSIGDDVTRDTFGDVVGGAMVGKITGGVGGALAKPATVVAPDGGVIDPNAGPISRAAATAINTGAAQQNADKKTAEAAAQEQQQQQSEAKQQQDEAAKAFTGKAQFDDPVKWWEALNGAGQTALIQKLDGDERQTALDLMATARDPRTSGAIREKAAGMLYGIAQNIGLPGTVAPVSPLALPSPKKDGDQIANENIEKWSAKFPALTLPQVQHMQRLASEQGHDDFAIVPHSSGEGYTLVPQSWVGQSAVTKESTALQGEGNGLLPSPNTPRSGTFVAGKDGVRQQTYGDLDTTAQRAISEASETLGDRKPQPAQVIRNADPTNDVSTKVKPGAVEGEYIRGRQAAEQYFPFKNPQQAEARAMAATKEFGEEYGVEPHPSVKGAFAVVPASKAQSNGRQESEQLFSESGIAQGVEQGKQTSRFVAKSVQNVRPAGASSPKLLSAPVDEAAHAAATSPKNDLPQPTLAQIEAGNYPKGHVTIGGLGISIENPSGSTRSGTNADGKAWQTTMRDHYGYVKRSTGADKDQVDVFIKGGTAPDHSGDVYVVDQVDPKTGQFDEHKALLGYRNMMQAAAAYRAHYEKGWKGMGAITPMPMEEFKKWVKSPEAAKPLALENKPSTEPVGKKPETVSSQEGKPNAGTTETGSKTVRDERAPSDSAASPVGTDAAATVPARKGAATRKRAGLAAADAPNGAANLADAAAPQRDVGGVGAKRDDSPEAVAAFLRQKLRDQQAAPGGVVDDRLAAQVASLDREAAKATTATKPTANTIFTEDAAAAARARLKAKLGRVSSGIDPETMMDGITLAGYHIEKGARTFAAYARAMLDDLGDGVKPYLKSWYMGVKYDPRAIAFDGMDANSVVDSTDLDKIAAEAQSEALEPENANPLQTKPVPERDGSTNQPNASTGDRDSESLGAGLADGRKGADSVGRVSGSVESAGTAGARSSEQSGQQSPSAARDSAGVRPESEPTTSEDNHVLDGEDIGKGGIAKKYRDNVAAIRIIKAMEADNRVATPEERKQIARYVGWGAMKGAFDPQNKAWAKQHAELKELLTGAEFDAARKSTLDAHYTSPIAVNSMFDVMERLGFKGGRVLEPSVGVGNFFGLMPAKMRGASQLHGVELDKLTSRLVAALYPKAKIAQAIGFEDFSIPSGYFDVVIGNPPFGSQPLVDMERSPYSGFSIHNYFLAKGIDKLRPGGIMQVVVSHNFLDAQDGRARQWIAERADLIAAVRLPDTAFKENAGTEVVTDILVFQRREPGTAPNGTAWAKVKDQVNINHKTGESATHRVNEFFVDNPSNILGEPSAAGKMYGPNQYTVVANGDLKQQLADWVKTVPENIYTPIARKPEKAALDMAIPEGIKVGSYYVDATGKVMRRGEDVVGEKSADAWTPLNAKALDRMRGMIGLRDLLRAQMRLERSQDSSEGDIEANRSEMNAAYDKFLKEFGHLNSRVNRSLFLDDTESPLLQALEFDYDQGVSAAVADREGIEQRKPSAVKADILNRRVAFPPQDFLTVSTAKDALLASLNYRGKVDTAYMSEVYGGKDASAIVKELGDIVFMDPQGGIVTADEYLSGDVKTKLDEARAAAADNPDLKRNVTALDKVIPVDKKPSEISVSIGASFVPAETYAEFVKHISGGDAVLAYVRTTGQWLMQAKGAVDPALNTGKFGTSDLSAQDLFQMSLLGRGAVVKVTTRLPGGGTETRVLEKETELAREKQNAIRDEWKKWIWGEPARADSIAAIYNDKMNRIVERSYDGLHLTFPGMNPAIKLLDHQKSGVWRGLQSYQVLYDHVVGAGKTFEMATLAMEMRRLGIARKPFFAVPNHLTLQWRSEFSRLYPGSNVLAATPDDFSKENRERFFSKIATGDWDAVIVGHSSLKKFGLPEETERAVLEEQITELADAIEDMKRTRNDRNIIRDMEGIRARLEAKMKERLAAIGERSKVLTFDQLGIDAMFIDEMHEFKNLAYNSTMDRNPGMGNPAGSAKAFDMFVKVRWLFDTFGEKTPFVTATGTPVSNSLVEMFNMQRYMQYPTLKAAGLHVFDAWAKQYGSVENVYEVAPSGSGFRQSTRFAKFNNLPSLMGYYGTFADTVTLDDLKAQEEARGKRFPVPKMVGGRPTLVVAKRSPLQAGRMGVPTAEIDADTGKVRFGADLNDAVNIEADAATGKFDLKVGTSSLGRYDTEQDAKIKLVELALSPRVNVANESILGRFANLRQLTKETKGKVNALSLTGEANKVGLDFRLVVPSAPDFEGSKINLAVNNIVEQYKKWTSDKGTQLVFCDMSIPLSARSTFGSTPRRLYVLNDTNGVEMKRGTMHTVEGHEDLPFFIVQRGEKESKKFDIYDAASGASLISGLPTKLAAREWADTTISSAEKRERWVRHRETVGELTQDRIDEYNNDNDVETDGIESFTREDIAGMSGSSAFSVYDDIKSKLVAKGIPDREVAFIHDYATPAAKDKLFKAVNSGDIRVLLGSTPKMGAGTNVQKRLIALHHIDAPWRPSDLEQREGRIIRRGNELYERDPDNFAVFVGRYATEQTYDTRRWQILEHKARGIEQLRNYDGTMNEIEDIEGEAANAADMKAAAAGDPLILEETQLRNEVKRLENMQSAHADQVVSLRRKANEANDYATIYGPRHLAEIRALTKTVAANKVDKEGFAPLTIDGKTLTTKEAAGEAAAQTVAYIREGMKGETTMKYRGVEFVAMRSHSDVVRVSSPTGEVGAWSGKDPFSPSGFMQRLVNYVGRLPAMIEDTTERIAKSARDSTALHEQAKAPFPNAEALETARTAHKTVQRKLMAKGPEVPEHQKQAVADGMAEQRAALERLGFGDALKEFQRNADVLGASASGKATAFDKLLHAGIAEGRTASDTLKAIQKASRNPFYRELAGALLKSGVDPALELGNPKGLKFSVKNRAAESFAAAFFPKANKVQLFTDANAERNLLHEIMHAATYRAIRKPSLASGQLRALFSHVKKSGQLKGMYGMENMDEFIAEAFSNPKFQAALKGVDAATLRGGKLGSAFDWFVRIVRALLGLKQGQESALSQVIEIGSALIDEQRNMLYANSIRTGVMGNSLENANFAKWFGDSKVVDADGKPLVVYHGTAANPNKFKADSGLIWFTDDYDAAMTYGHPKYNMVKAHLSIKVPANDADVAKAAKSIGIPRTEIAGEYGAKVLELDGVSAELARRGFDGAIVSDTSSEGSNDITAYVAFSPNQIKSATGNDGSYSLDDDSIMGNIAEDRDMQARIRDKANELLSTKKTFNWWNNTVGTQYAKAEKDADFKRVFDATQDYIGDVSRIANAAADQAPSLLPKTEGLRDVFKKDVSTADRAAIAKPIFQGTLTDSKVYADDELRAQFGLTDKQIGYYREHRAAIDQSLDDLLKTDLLRYVGKAATGLRDAVMQANSPSAAAKIISDRMQQVTGLSDEQVRDYLAAADDAEKVALGFNTAQITAINDIATVRDKADRIDQLKNEGYAPLMRFGRYAVYTTDPTGETIAFTLHETEREATKRAAQMRADNPDATVVQSVMSEEAYKLYAGMEPETLELFAEMSGLEQTPAFQEYLKMTKSNRSAMKRLIKREGIAGFNDDPVRGLAAFITSNARAGSKNLHFGDMLQAAADIPREKGDVLDEAVRLIKYVQDPKQEAQAIRGLLFANYIGGSLASAAVNLTQPLTMTFPYLSQFGTALAAKEMTAAMRTALGKSITNPELAAALKRAESDGIVSPQEIHQLEAEASGRFGKNQYVRKGAYLWGSMFSLAEQYNRRVTFIAAYNMAKANGELDPFKFAEKAVQETQGIYNKGNRPNWARGALGATIFTFKQFSISYLEFLMRLPQKERAIALGILLLTAGMQGMPGADDADDVIDTIGQGLGYDTNSKAWKTRALTEAIGREGAEFVMRGGSALPGFPIDVAGRMGMGNLIPGTGVLLKSKADKGSEFAEPLGAAGSFAKDILSGKVAPLAIRNVAKAVDMYQTGMYRDEKGRKVVDTDGFDAIVKGIGFQPADVARDSRSAQIVQQTVDLAKNVESDITQKWAESIFERNQSKFKAAMEKLIDWNQKNPNTPIAINPSQIKRRIMEMTIDRESRLMKRAPKELRAQMMELYQ